MIEMIISSFIVGFLVAVPPGTVTVVAAQKSILYGFKESMVFTIGSCLSDIFYILIVLFGIAPLFAESSLFKIIFWYFSSILLFYFGFDAFRALKKKIAFFNNPIKSNDHCRVAGHRRWIFHSLESKLAVNPSLWHFHYNLHDDRCFMLVYSPIICYQQGKIHFK
jgi:threonine/homoserine/homoserine lactone efflux protein